MVEPSWILKMLMISLKVAVAQKVPSSKVRDFSASALVASSGYGGMVVLLYAGQPDRSHFQSSIIPSRQLVLDRVKHCSGMRSGATS